jgi:hypothetical protein
MLVLTDNLEWWIRRFGRAPDGSRPAKPATDDPAGRHAPALPRTGRFDRPAARRRAAGSHPAGPAASRR